MQGKIDRLIIIKLPEYSFAEKHQADIFFCTSTLNFKAL